MTLSNKAQGQGLARNESDEEGSVAFCRPLSTYNTCLPNVIVPKMTRIGLNAANNTGKLVCLSSLEKTCDAKTMAFSNSTGTNWNGKIWNFVK